MIQSSPIDQTNAELWQEADRNSIPNEGHGHLPNREKFGVSESEVLDSIGDEAIEDERNHSHDKKINYSSITRAGAVKEVTAANHPLATIAKELKASHSSS